VRELISWARGEAIEGRFTEAEDELRKRGLS
jgi:hypothetical protein